SSISAPHASGEPSSTAISSRSGYDWDSTDSRLSWRWACTRYAGTITLNLGTSHPTVVADVRPGNGRWAVVVTSAAASGGIRSPEGADPARSAPRCAQA